MRRRIFAGLLALAMMLTVIPATDVHAETVSGNSVEQEKEEATVECNNSIDCTATEHSEDCPALYPPCDTEGCELVKGHQGECTGVVIYETLQASSVAKIGDEEYTKFENALEATKNMTGDVTVEIYDKVTLNTSLAGSYDSIKFVGGDTDAEIYLDVQGYITANGKKVTFEELTLSKSAGGFITNAGFMNVAFGVYEVNEVTYTNCVFANGAYASAGKVTFTGCTFYRSHEKYGLWAYGNVDVTVDDCTFADYRGIKMYAEGAAKTVDLTVKNTDFSAVNNKPAIVLTYGESVTLENNTYSDTGVFELDLDGAPNGTTVTSDVTPTCKNDNGACGVLVDGKIYTTLENAFAAAAESDEITLLADATPALTSQRAITKASVIDLGGKTLTLTEDDLYFGTTTFKNGNIIVAPSVKPSTAVFWMFANQTLTFDNVKLTATGVTGTYLIGLDGNNSDLNLLNGSEIIVNNGTALDLDIICVNESTGNDITIDDSKVNVTNLDGRVFFRGNYIVSGNSDINLSGITKAGFRIEAGQTLSIEDTATVDIEGEPRDGGIHLTDVTAKYKVADTATVNATVNKPAIENGETLQKAINAAEAGETIKLDGDIKLTEGIEVNKELTLDLNGKKISAVDTQSKTALIKAVNGAKLTITGEGTVNSASHGNDYSIAVWAADGAKVTIENGTFTNVGAKSVEDNGTTPNNNELIYVSGSGEIIINGGTFTGNKENATYGVKYALNKQDNCAGTIKVYGGTYYGYDPSSSHSENPVGNFVAEGYEAVASGSNYVVGKHSPKLVAKVDSTCTATGTNAHYKCDLCSRLYLNTTDTKAVTEADLVIEKKAHTPEAELVNVKAATCTAEGYTGDEVCSVCGTTTKAGTVTAALGHNFDEKTGVCKNNCGSQIIVDAGEVDVLVQPEETEHKVSEDIPEDVKVVATEIASSVTTSTESLTKAVEETAESYANDEELIAQAKEVLNVEKDEDVQIIVKPHLETEIKMIETTEAPEAEKPLVVVEINLVYDVVAKKADGSAEEHLKEVKVTNPGKALEMSFEVSEQIAEMLQEMIAAGKKIYIKHPKKNGDVYFHEARLDGKKVKFTNNAGFSEFTLMYGDEVPANVIKSTSGSVQSTIAMYAETGEYIEVSSVSESIIEEGKDELRALIGDSYGKYRLALAADLHAKLNGSTKIKILVDDVTAADAVIILHKGADGWEAISNKAGDGYVIGKFSSLSPVLVFVDEDGELEAAQTAAPVATVPAGSTTPAPTGDNANIVGLSLTMIACAAAIVLFARRRVNK